MNGNKKDVNDYFKYLKLYYIALHKKKLKELEEKKKKDEEILSNKKRKLENELINRRKKVVTSKPLAIKTKDTKVNKQEVKNPKAIRNIGVVNKSQNLEKIKKKQQEKLIAELNKKKEEEKKKKEFEEKKKQEEKVKKENEIKKKLDEEKKKKELEEKKKQEDINKKKKEDIEKQKKYEEAKKKQQEKLKKEVEEKRKKELEKEQINKEDKKSKNNQIKGIDQKNNNNNKNDENKNNKYVKNGNLENDKKSDKEKDNKEISSKEKDVKNKDKKTKDKDEKEKEVTKSSLDEKEKNNKGQEKVNQKKNINKEKVLGEDDKNKYLEAGKKEFISSINKKIKKDYESLHELDMEIHRIKQELENENDLEEINKLIVRADKNNKEIKGVINRINMIKDGTIIDIAYSLSKKQPKELKDYIELLKKESNNTKYLNDLYPSFKYNLGYVDEANYISKQNDVLLNNINNKKDNLNKLDVKKDTNEKTMDNYNNKILKFRDKLLKFQMSMMNYSNKIKNIVPKEELVTKYFLGDKEIKNSMELKKISLKIASENNKNPEEIFNNLRSKLKVVEEKNIVPSDNFKIDLLNEKNSLNITRKEIFETLAELKEFKNEFSSEYNDVLDTNEFYNYYSSIESLENKLYRENEKANIINKEIDKNILENDKKIIEIEKINSEKKKQEKEKKENEEKNKNAQNQQNTLNQNFNQYMNINNVAYNNMFQNQYQNQYDNYEYEEEKTRGGRSR